MAEALFRKMTDNRHEVISAGIKLSGAEQPIEELGSIIDNLNIVMKEEGLDISKNIRKQVTQEMINDAEKIILTVDERDLIPDNLRNNQKVVIWNVVDPKNQSLEFTRQIKDQIKDLIENFLKSLL